ncbi:hypothetical protein DXT63_12035 [Thermoanaerobacteraceae bacterium SP2]|nr:hypothetical protein DXT63_12035 [Thermoanaerobacteraceae bacterium SP2]
MIPIISEIIWIINFKVINIHKKSKKPTTVHDVVIPS